MKLKYTSKSLIRIISTVILMIMLAATQEANSMAVYRWIQRQLGYGPQTQKPALPPRNIYQKAERPSIEERIGTKIQKESKEAEVEIALRAIEKEFDESQKNINDVKYKSNLENLKNRASQLPDLIKTKLSDQSAQSAQPYYNRAQTLEDNINSAIKRREAREKQSSAIERRNPRTEQEEPVLENRSKEESNVIQPSRGPQQKSAAPYIAPAITRVSDYVPSSEEAVEVGKQYLSSAAEYMSSATEYVKKAAQESLEMAPNG